MPDGYFGQAGHLGSGKESTWGTRVAIALWQPEVSDAGIGPELGQDFPDVVAGVLAQRRIRTGVTRYAGSTGFAVVPNGIIGQVLIALFGQVTTTHNTVGASYNSSNHSFTRTNTTDKPSLTLEHNYGGLFTRQYVGCRPERVRLSLANAEAAVLEASVDWIAKSETSSAAGTTSFPTEAAFAFNTFTASVDNNANTRVRDFEVTFETNPDAYIAAGNAGEITGLPLGPLNVTGRMSLQYLGTERRADYTGNTGRRLGFRFIGNSIGGSANQLECHIEVFAARFTSHEGALAPGGLIETLDFTGLYDATNDVARVRLVDTTSGY